MSVANPQVKLSRKLNIALTPKASKYMERRPYPPGEHGQQKNRRRKVSDYALQLLEKQRLRLQYNLREKQMRNYVRKAIRKSGNAADNLVQALEQRLDALVYRSGFARTLPAARQFVSHGHILVNGRKVDIPSCAINPGDVVALDVTLGTLDDGTTYPAKIVFDGTSEKVKIVVSNSGYKKSGS